MKVATARSLSLLSLARHRLLHLLRRLPACGTLITMSRLLALLVAVLLAVVLAAPVAEAGHHHATHHTATNVALGLASFAVFNQLVGPW